MTVKRTAITSLEARTFCCITFIAFIVIHYESNISWKRSFCEVPVMPFYQFLPRFRLFPAIGNNELAATHPLLLVSLEMKPQCLLEKTVCFTFWETSDDVNK